MTAHNLSRLHTVRRPTARRVDHVGGLSQIQRTDGNWRDDAQRLCKLHPMVVEPVNGPAGNAEGLAGPDVDLLAVDGPGQDPVGPIDRLFIPVVAVSRGDKPLSAGDGELEGSDAPMGLVTGDQEANGEGAEPYGLVRRVDGQGGRSVSLRLRLMNGCCLTAPHKLRPEARLRDSGGRRRGWLSLRRPTAEDVSFMRK
jgi:hypothetical protein